MEKTEEKPLPVAPAPKLCQNCWRPATVRINNRWRCDQCAKPKPRK